MKKIKQKKGAVKAVFFLMLLWMLTGCSAKKEAGLPEGLLVQEDRIVTADEATGAAQEESASQEESTAETAAAPDSPDPVYVHICGEVPYPGVYCMPYGSRIYEAVERAGGLLASADETAVNQALAVEDGMKVWIPPKEETADKLRSRDASNRQNEADAGGAEKGADAYITVGGDSVSGMVPADGLQTKEGRVNINTATENELCTLNGIGESRAKSIIQYRNEHGNFQKPEDIMKVSGIKDGAFAKIKDEIVVE